MEHFELIRRMVFVEGLSIREVARRLNHSRSSVRKALQHSAPPSYQQQAERTRPKLDPFMPLIRQWLIDDLQQPRKQRHTAARIWERLRDEHQYAGGRRGVSDAVKQIRSELVPPEIFVPIDHPCGEEFQIDWGEVTVKLNNEVKKMMIFCARSAYSKATFVRAYLRDDMTSFCDAHVWLFETLGGVPKRLAYDNLSTAVTSVGKRGQRTLTGKFIELRSHYLFETRFCNVAAGNEKGHVENSVKRAERTYLTPVPCVTGISELNEHLSREAAKDLTRSCKETKKSYGELHAQEQPTFLSLPPSRFVAAISRSQKADRQSTVTAGNARYSVPVKHACQPVVVRMFIDRVEVIRKDEIIATHDRIEAGLWSLQLEHYLPVLQRKPGLLDSGIPFKNKAWSDSERLLRRELEYRCGEEGTRQFLSIVLLCKEHPWSLVRAAIESCVKARAFHEEAVRMELARLLQQPLDASPSCPLDLRDRPDLEIDNSGMRDLSVYDRLFDNAPTTTTELETEVSAIVSSVEHVASLITFAPLTMARSANDDEEETDADKHERAKKERSQSARESIAAAAAADDAQRVSEDGATMYVGECDV